MLPYLIGVTGRIATGKSSLSKYASQLIKCPYINCDASVHELYSHSPIIRMQLKTQFGEGVIENKNGKEMVNRKILRDIAFSSQLNLNQLNTIILPHLSEFLKQKIKQLPQPKFIIIEGATIIEVGWASKFDCIWATYSSNDVISRRLKYERKIDDATIKKIIQYQYNDHEHIPYISLKYDSGNPFNQNKIIIDKEIQKLIHQNVSAKALSRW